MNKKKKATKILSRLRNIYPNRQTMLNWKNPWELLVSTVLAAQCTDKRVNQVTPNFFARWPTIESLASTPPNEVEDVIRSTGFFRNKAKNLIACAQKIVQNYEGKVPQNMNELLSLPGIARKTANIILSNAFGINAGIAVDTHVKRLSYRLGLSNSTNPNIIEKDLQKLFPKDSWGEINHLLVNFGRDICKARRPECAQCMLNDICSKQGIVF